MKKERTKEAYCPINNWFCPYYRNKGKCAIDDEPIEECDDCMWFYYDEYMKGLNPTQMKKGRYLKMNELSELAKIIYNKLITLKSDEIITVVFLPAENIYVLKTLKDDMYMHNSKIFETDPFTPSFTYTDILRILDIFFERLKMY